MASTQLREITRTLDIVVDTATVEALLAELELLAGQPGLEALSTNECFHYLAAETLGRVGLVTAGVAVMLPVNYVFTNGRVVFRTGVGTKLRTVMTGSPLSFEIDHHGPGEGWSVFAVGAAQATTDPQALAAAQAAGLRPEAPGAHEYLVELVPVVITGRRYGHLDPSGVHRRSP